MVIKAEKKHHKKKRPDIYTRTLLLLFSLVYKEAKEVFNVSLGRMALLASSSLGL
ncbi:hypothetical protein QFZ20_002893 [Flavobacterium sp. W4I14]|nr:hypothetical protein [Flavobacterium sp. W4I14]